MNHPRITALLCALAVVLAAIGALGGAVAHIATDETFYLDDSRRAVAVYLGREPGQTLTEDDEAAVTRYVGLTREEQAPVARRIAEDMRLPAAAFEEGLGLLNAREQRHLGDVRDLVLHARSLSKALTALAAALAVAAAWTGAGLKKRARPALAGTLCAAGALALLALALAAALFSGGFAPLFVGMHELLFTNDFWLLDPEKDILIRMMPQPLFEAALGRVLASAGGMLAATLAALAALYGMLGGMIRRNFCESDQRKA